MYELISEFVKNEGVVVAITEPLASTAKKEPAGFNKPMTARFVVVAFVNIPVVMLASVDHKVLTVPRVVVEFTNVLNPEVAVKYEETVSPTIESFAYGDVVPIPIFPFSRIDIKDDEALFTKLASIFPPVPLPQTVNLEYGVVVPMPTLPLVALTIMAGRVPTIVFNCNSATPVSLPLTLPVIFI